jgi:hypothetical protein
MRIKEEPSAANRWATERPIPRDAPVIMVFLPVRTPLGDV